MLALGGEDVLERKRGGDGDALRDAGGFAGAAEFLFAFGVDEAGHCGGRAEDGGAHRVGEHGCRGGNSGDVDEDAGAKADLGVEARVAGFRVEVCCGGGDEGPGFGGEGGGGCGFEVVGAYEGGEGRF